MGPEPSIRSPEKPKGCCYKGGFPSQNGTTTPRRYSSLRMLPEESQLLAIEMSRSHRPRIGKTDWHSLRRDVQKRRCARYLRTGTPTSCPRYFNEMSDCFQKRNKAFCFFPPVCVRNPILPTERSAALCVGKTTRPFPPCDHDSAASTDPLFSYPLGCGHDPRRRSCRGFEMLLIEPSASVVYLLETID